MNRALFVVFAAWFLFCAKTMAANAVGEGVDASEVQNDLETLRLRLDNLEEKVNTPQIRPNLFNPGITAFGNFLTCAGQGYPESAHGLCEKPFVFREAELDLRASVDPWADAVLILAFEPAHVHGHDQEEPTFNVEIEEAYITLKKIPLVNDTLQGLQFKVGRFRSRFGRFNQIHLHDMPQITLPSSMQAFLGGHGMMRNGFSSQFLIPTPGDNNALNLTVEIVDGGGTALDAIDDTRLPAGLAHISWFWDVAPAHDIDIGLSAYVEARPAYERPAQIYGADFNYRWRPYILGDKHSFLLGGEAYLAPVKDQWKFGSFGFAQFQFNQWTYLGVRYDYQDVLDHHHTVGAFLTYYTTEFLRLRVGVESLADPGFTNVRTNGLFEINFVFGSHPVEPYWVNR